MSDETPHAPPPLEPLELHVIECGLCVYKATGLTILAAHAGFMDHNQWHRDALRAEAAS